MTENPVVSFVLIAYNQARFIREAVQSALAQTYEPLEIILSDDCSSDGTYEIMKEVVDRYGGPHRVILNRNAQNGGLAVNFNRACSLTTGELIVVQAGDDVSHSNRTAILIQAWESPSSVDLLFSNAEVIDADGGHIRDRWFERPVEVSSLNAQDVFRRQGIGVLGGSAAFSKSLIAKYGEINSLVSAEDSVLSFRALLGRGIRYVDEVLVKYRVHGNNLVHGRTDWRTSDRIRARRDAIGRLAIVQDCLKAYDLSGLDGQNVPRTLERLERQYAYDVACYERSRMGSMLLAVKGLCTGIGPRKASGLIRRHVLRGK